MAKKPVVDWKKPIQTVSGKRCRVLCTDVKCDQPVLVAVLDAEGGEYVEDYSLDGSFCLGERGSEDIINVPARPADDADLAERLNDVFDGADATQDGMNAVLHVLAAQFGSMKFTKVCDFLRGLAE
jgi:hypothetical protein